MTELRLILYEIGRLFRVKKTWLFIAAFVIAPVFLATDMFGFGNSFYGSMSDVFILQPAKQAAFAGVIAALFLTLFEIQRMAKYRMAAIIETATTPLRNQLRQTLAIITVTTLSVLASLCVLLLYTSCAMDCMFKILPFLAGWVFIYFGAILTTILLASGIYLITKNFNISFIVVGILAIISFFTAIGDNYLLFWVQTRVESFSDATESLLQIDVIMYTRLVWLLIAGSVYTLGLACMRRYGRNLLHSVLLSCKKVILPVLAAVLAFSAVISFCCEPFFDNGPVIKYERAVDPDTGIVIYKTDYNSFDVDESKNYSVEITNGKADITVDTERRVLKGEATFTIYNPSKVADVLFSITPGLDFSEVYENGTKIEYRKNNLDNFMCSVYHIKLTSDKKGTLRIVYGGSPKSSKDQQIRMWGITDKFVMIPYIYPESSWNSSMNCRITLPENLTPIMEDTVLTEVQSEKTGYKTYEYKSSGRRWLIAGEYNIEKLNAGGQEIQFIYLKGREKAIKESGAAAVVADVVDFFTEKFGPLDFKGKPFIIAELDGSFVNGGWGLGNMSVFGESMFAGTAYKGNPDYSNVESGSGIGVAVHEIAHQWWGWSPDSVYITDDGRSPWSGEGLTVYSTYLYMKERFGEEFAKREYTDVWEKDSKKMQNAFYLTHLQYAGKLPENDAADIYMAFSEISRYEMMPYLLLKAQKLVGGEDAFVAALKSINEKYRQQELSYNVFLMELGLKKEDILID